MDVFLIGQQLPDVLDVEKMTSEESFRYRLLDPPSRREIWFVKAASVVDGWVEVYCTLECAPNDPQVIKFDGKPTCRRFAENVVKDGFLRCPTVKIYRPFDVIERSTGAIVKQVRPRMQSTCHR